MTLLGDTRVRVRRKTDLGHLLENSVSELSWHDFQNTQSNPGLVGGTLSLDLLSYFHPMSAILFFISNIYINSWRSSYGAV